MFGHEIAALSVPDELARLLVATILGAVIGFERERGERAAGLRTHALVASASALMMLVSAFGFADAVTASRTIVLDPSRIAAQVVSGVGFLGAGSIILRKDTVQGLTTAGSIWMVAGIGLACGAGMYVAAGAATLLALVTLLGLKAVERRLFAHKRMAHITLRVQRSSGQLGAIEAAIQSKGLQVQRVQVDATHATAEQRIRLDVRGGGQDVFPALAQQLHTIAGVRMVAYRVHNAAGDST